MILGTISFVPSYFGWEMSSFAKSVFLGLTPILSGST